MLQNDDRQGSYRDELSYTIHSGRSLRSAQLSRTFQGDSEMAHQICQRSLDGIYMIDQSLVISRSILLQVSSFHRLQHPPVAKQGLRCRQRCCGPVQYSVATAEPIISIKAEQGVAKRCIDVLLFNAMPVFPKNTAWQNLTGCRCLAKGACRQCSFADRNT